MKFVSKSCNKTTKNGKNHGHKSKSKQSNCKPAECSSSEDEKEDLSLLKQQIEISVRGVNDLIKSVSNGTAEFKEIALHECNLIYECRVCKNLFRSLANFITHKRAYCRKKYNFYRHDFPSLESESATTFIVQPEIFIEPEPCDPSLDKVNDWTTSDKLPETEHVSLSNSKEQEVSTAARTKITAKRDIAKVINNLTKLANNKEVVNTTSKTTTLENNNLHSSQAHFNSDNLREEIVILENNDKSENSVFQTIVSSSKSKNESIKTEVLELENMSKAAVLKENGNFILTYDVSRLRPIAKLVCTYCKSKFVTRKTLTKHIKIHHWERTCYPCPLCKIYFATPWAVYRHLGKVHHRTEDQIRRLRSQVLRKAIKRRMLHAPPKLKCGYVNDVRIDTRENEKWMNNFEGELRCNGCGKLFNRRAALNVHNIMCKVNNTRSGVVKVDKSEVRETTPPCPPLQQQNLQILSARSPKIIPPVYQSGKISIQIRKDYNKETSASGSVPVAAGCSSSNKSSLPSPRTCDVCKCSVCSCELKQECCELVPELQVLVPICDTSDFSQAVDNLCVDLTKWKYLDEDLDDPFCGFTTDDLDSDYDEPYTLSLLEAEYEMLGHWQIGYDSD